MKFNKLKYIIFSLVFVYSFLWTAINLFASSLGKEKTPLTVIENQEIQQLVLSKTGIDIVNLKISESPHPFGMMIGIPTQPQLVLSRGLYETFTPEAMEYVVLHEAGHYALWHGTIEFVAGIVLFGIGIYLLKKMTDTKKSLVLSLVIGLLFGILMVQIGKLHELQTDKFTIQRIGNPSGMIEATNKFRDYHGKKYSQNTNPVIQFLFYRANPYDNRIKMAELEIESRK